MHRPLYLVLGLSLWGSTPVFGAGAVEVTYDRNQDHISVRASDATLSEIFAQLARKAGIESQMAATVTADRVSVDQPARPLVEILRQLLRGYSYTVSYRTDASDHKRLTVVTILGAAGKAAAASVLPPVRHVAVGWQATPENLLPNPAADLVVRGNSGIAADSHDAIAVASAPDTAEATSASERTSHASQSSSKVEASQQASANSTGSITEAAPVSPPPGPIPAWRIGPGGSILDP